MDKNKALAAYHIVTALKELNRLRTVVNKVLSETDNGDITVSSKAWEEDNFFSTEDKNIIRDIRIGLDIRISDLKKEMEYL